MKQRERGGPSNEHEAVYYAASRCQSGRRLVLLRVSPHRTVHASLKAHGSSASRTSRLLVLLVVLLFHLWLSFLRQLFLVVELLALVSP